MQTSHLEDEHGRYLELKGLLEDREKTLQQLREETAFLDKQHNYTKNEVGLGGEGGGGG